MRGSRRTVEGQAEDVVNEYLERDLVPSRIVGDVTAHLENDEPLQALETILDARDGYAGVDSDARRRE